MGRKKSESPPRERISTEMLDALRDELVLSDNDDGVEIHSRSLPSLSSMRDGAQVNRQRGGGQAELIRAMDTFRRRQKEAARAHQRPKASRPPTIGSVSSRHSNLKKRRPDKDFPEMFQKSQEKLNSIRDWLSFFKRLYSPLADNMSISHGMRSFNHSGADYRYFEIAIKTGSVDVIKYGMPLYKRDIKPPADELPNTFDDIKGDLEDVMGLGSYISDIKEWMAKIVPNRRYEISTTYRKSDVDTNIFSVKISIQDLGDINYSYNGFNNVHIGEEFDLMPNSIEKLRGDMFKTLIESWLLASFGEVRAREWNVGILEIRSSSGEKRVLLRLMHGNLAVANFSTSEHTTSVRRENNVTPLPNDGNVMATYAAKRLLEEWILMGTPDSSKYQILLRHIPKPDDSGMITALEINRAGSTLATFAVNQKDHDIYADLSPLPASFKKFAEMFEFVRLEKLS